MLRLLFFSYDLIIHLCFDLTCLGLHIHYSGIDDFWLLFLRDLMQFLSLMFLLFFFHCLLFLLLSLFFSCFLF